MPKKLNLPKKYRESMGAVSITELPVFKEIDTTIKVPIVYAETIK